MITSRHCEPEAANAHLVAFPARFIEAPSGPVAVRPPKPPVAPSRADFGPSRNSNRDARKRLGLALLRCSPTPSKRGADRFNRDRSSTTRFRLNRLLPRRTGAISWSRRGNNLADGSNRLLPSRE